MKIVLDVERCVGHGRCYALGPELFDADDEGHAVVLVEADVPADLEERARVAIANCPEGALTLST